MVKPIFYDPTGTRRRWSQRGVLLVAVLLFSAVAMVAFSVISVAIPSALPVWTDRNQPRPLRAQLYSLRHGVKKFSTSLSSWLPRPRRGAENVNQRVVGFYVPWDPVSRESLERHIGDIDWLVPVAATINGPTHQFNLMPNTHIDQILALAPHRPQIFPLVQNAMNDKWDGPGSAALFHSPAARAQLISQLANLVTTQNGKGVVLDFEELPAQAMPDYVRFIGETRIQFAKHGWQVMVTAPPDDPSWPLAAMGKVANKLFLMDYDEHDPHGPAGPIASQEWFDARMAAALTKVPANKLIVALA
ncbi:MAG: polysaccharide deacetylase, partial [Alphaproteobacteria bacterium]|nr:polysaccharide deacetylase [Alphaproteobacteria bacterium]